MNGSIMRTVVAVLAGTVFMVGTSPQFAGAQDAKKHAPAHGAADEPPTDHADGGGAAAHDEHAAHEEHGHAGPKVYGKPPVSQLGPGAEFLTVSPQLFGWTLAIFLLTLWILTKTAWQPIIAALDERERRIADTIAEADRARDEARKLLEYHDEEMSNAHRRAKELLDEARTEASRDGEALISKTREEAGQAQQEAEDKIKQAAELALVEIKRSAAGLAAGLAGRVVGKEFSADDCTDLIEEADQ